MVVSKILPSLFLIPILNAHNSYPCALDSDGCWSIASLQISGYGIDPLAVGAILYNHRHMIGGPSASSSNLSERIKILNSWELKYSPQAITCHTASSVSLNKLPSIPVHFVADPFLFLVPKQALSFGTIGYKVAGIKMLANKIHHNLVFAFYEVKNGIRMKGEIGASVSADKGKSWKNLGIILSSFEHLSYPFIVQDMFQCDDGEDGEIVMLPQSNPLITSLKSYVGSQRIFTTKPSLFPFGWIHTSTPLIGGKYADASPVFYQGRWYVWITEIEPPGKRYKYELKLYNIEGYRLSQGRWLSHPANPISVDMRYARMGGRPVISNGKLYRPAQDCSEGYGSRITWMLITRLTPSEYEEKAYTEIVPINREPRLPFIFPTPRARTRANNRSSKGAAVLTETQHIRLNPLLVGPKDRLHHVDAQEESPGKWMVLIDGEGFPAKSTPDEAEPVIDVQSEPSSTVMELSLMVMLVFIIMTWYHRDWFPYGSLNHQRNISILSTIRKIQFKLQSRSCYFFERYVWLYESMQHVFAATLGAAIFFLPFLLSYYLIKGPLKSYGVYNVYSSNYYLARPKSTYEYKTEIPIQLPPDSPYPIGDLHVITGASAPYYTRLINLIGSFQHFEPNQKLIIYDLGLTSEQLQQVVCMKNIELIHLNFNSYPAHVKLLYNFAWKILLMKDFSEKRLSHMDAFLYLDAGMQVTAPFLKEVKERMRIHGHMSTTQSVILDEFHPNGFSEYVTKVIGSFNLPYGIRYCAGGVQGYVKGSRAYRTVLNVAVKCALDTHCLENIEVQDQALFTALLRRNGFVCERKDIFAGNNLERLLPDPTIPHPSIKLVALRSRIPKLFASRVQWNDSCDIIPPSASAYELFSRPLVRHKNIHERGRFSYQREVWRHISGLSRFTCVMRIILNIGFVSLWFFMFILFSSVLPKVILKVSPEFSKRIRNIVNLYAAFLAALYILAIIFVFFQSHYGIFI